MNIDANKPLLRHLEYSALFYRALAEMAGYNQKMLKNSVNS